MLFSTFNGPINNALSVYCDEKYACRGAFIYAQKSSYFILMTGRASTTTDTASARSMTIWLPPKNGDQIRAYIITGSYDFTGYNGYNFDSLQLYAVNGWLDEMYNCKQVE